MACYKTGSCGSYEMYSCSESPTGKKEYLDETEFIKKYCNNCGSQRCEGIHSEWFEGCKYKNHYLNNKN